MKAQDVIVQLVGRMSEEFPNSYELDLVSLSGTDKHPENLIEINFISGVVTIYTDLDGTNIQEKFAIKATLEPLDK